MVRAVVLGAASTVLTGSAGSAALQLNTGISTSGNTINATDLTLRNAEGILNDAVGAIDCVLEETIERFGVLIAIGRVADVVVREGEPLLFFRGVYR